MSSISGSDDSSIYSSSDTDNSDNSASSTCREVIVSRVLPCPALAVALACDM